jgi:hypothetical protein
MPQDKPKGSSVLETMFTLMVFFSGALYVMKGPAPNAAVFWFRTGLLLIGLTGLGMLAWRRWSVRSNKDR